MDLYVKRRVTKQRSLSHGHYRYFIHFNPIKSILIQLISIPNTDRYKNLRQTNFLRPILRLFTGRIRVLGLIFILLAIVVLTARRLNAATDSNVIGSMTAYEFEEHLPNLKEHLRYAVLIDAG